MAGTSPPILVIGGSAGGVEALIRIAGQLPRDLPAAVFVALHFPVYSTSMLPRILERAGDLPAAHASDGARIEPGRIYVAPPDRHLIVLRQSVHVVRGPRENGHRPAIDPMFRSAAIAHGNRVVGVVLTGNLDDGTAGLLAIKRRGGIAIVQNPTEALFPSMPASALEHVDVDFVLPLSAIGDQLRALAEELGRRTEGAVEGPMSDVARREALYAELHLKVVVARGHHSCNPLPFS